VWVYTALYYPTVVVAAVLTSHSFREFAYTATVYLVLLAALTVAFFVMPVRTHDHWRAFDPQTSIHHRHLSWVQRIDGANNCFPSGHSAISVLTGGLLATQLGIGAGAAFAILVCLSCLFCKQHYVVDVLAGALLGGACLWLHGMLLA
jgi:membrane-associated phospholipid phosphatase